MLPPIKEVFPICTDVAISPKQYDLSKITPTKNRGTTEDCLKNKPLGPVYFPYEFEWTNHKKKKVDFKSINARIKKRQMDLIQIIMSLKNNSNKLTRIINKSHRNVSKPGYYTMNTYEDNKSIDDYKHVHLILPHRKIGYV